MRKRLKTLSDLRRYLSSKILDYDTGIIDETKLKTLTYAVHVLSAIVKDSDLEQRVTTLEKAAQDEIDNYSN